ncbi:MAG: AEC family transporter [Rubellimicrobium sp.]|nr:AEC family transporter [Rubellimicrobium sp.]
MSIFASIILPVFVLIAMGYAAAWRGLMPESAVDGLMTFAQGFAVPVLLFLAVSRLDLTQSFDPRLLVSFYLGAVSGFIVGLFGARLIFGRSWEDSVAIGFCGLFSNSLLLGLAITERAYGPEALVGNFVILSVHAPFCYMLGIATMELVKARGAALASLPGKIGGTLLRNALVIGIGLGFVVNLSGLGLPMVLSDGLEMIARAAIPTSLFGLGGVLFRYRPEGDMRVILFITAVSLLLHPTVTWLLAQGGAGGGLPLPGQPLEVDALRSAVLTAAMAPGVNAYVFANQNGHARRVAASAVLIGTAASMVTGAFWIWLLP